MVRKHDIVALPSKHKNRRDDGSRDASSSSGRRIRGSRDNRFHDQLRPIIDYLCDTTRNSAIDLEPDCTWSGTVKASLAVHFEGRSHVHVDGCKRCEDWNAVTLRQSDGIEGNRERACPAWYSRTCRFHHPAPKNAASGNHNLRIGPT